MVLVYGYGSDPNTKAFVLARIARVRILQADSAESESKRREHMEEARRRIEEILRLKVINSSPRFWARAMKESLDADPKWIQHEPLDEK